MLKVNRVRGRLVNRNTGEYGCPVCGQKWSPMLREGGCVYKGGTLCPNEKCPGRKKSEK